MMFCFLYLIGNLTYVFQAILHETTTQYRIIPTIGTCIQRHFSKVVFTFFVTNSNIVL